LKYAIINKACQCLFFLILMCGIACEHTGSTCCNYGQVFRGQWDDFYLRALACIERSNFQQALTDFQSSLERRPPSKQFDRRMVRTYGMHYLDYFPNREMGFVYYLQNQYQKALQYLDHSIQTEPSAKAYYYRNQVKKKLETLKSRPGLALTEPCMLTKSTCEIWRSQMPFVIAGTAKDQHCIDSITIQKQPIWIDHAAKTVDFTKKFIYQEGKHQICIQVMNIQGVAIEKQIILNVDQTGPTISIQKGHALDSVKIQAQDQSGQMTLFINNEFILSQKNQILDYQMSWPKGDSEIRICVNDRCKNKTCGTVTYAKLFQPPEISALIADNQGLIHSDISSPSGGLKTVNIHFNEQDFMTVYTDFVTISGHIDSSSPIARVLVNETPLRIQISKNIYFSRQVNLEPGKNQVWVFAKSLSGQFQRKALHIERKIPSVYHHQYRYGITMHSLHVNGSEKKHSWFDRWLGTNQKQDHITKQLGLHLFKDFQMQGRFRVKYRGNVSDRLKESIPYQASLLGNAYSSRFGLEITARVVDNQTSAVLGIKDVYRENNGDIDLHDMARELSSKIHGTFPLTCGKIIARMNNECRFECNNKIPGVAWPMLVYRKLPAIDTQIIGNGSIAPGNEMEYQGVVVLEPGNNEIQSGDWVIAR